MADNGDDLYRTIAAPAEALFKERSSKFFAYAFPVVSAEEALEIVERLRKKYYDATHHCYAYRLGRTGAYTEPMTTASLPERRANRSWDNCCRPT